MEEPSLEVVLKALDALFRKDDTQEKEQASLWLTQLQSSVRTTPRAILINAHHILLCACVICILVCMPPAGARVEGSRPATCATERYGDKLLCSSNYAEQSEISFPRVAT